MASQQQQRQEQKGAPAKPQVTKRDGVNAVFPVAPSRSESYTSTGDNWVMVTTDQHAGIVPEGPTTSELFCNARQRRLHLTPEFEEIPLNMIKETDAHKRKGMSASTVCRWTNSQVGCTWRARLTWLTRRSGSTRSSLTWA